MNFDAIFKNAKIVKIGLLEAKLWEKNKGNTISRTGNETISRTRNESISRTRNESISRTGNEIISLTGNESISRKTL